MIQLPASSTVQILQVVNDLFSSFDGFITLILGIFAFFLIADWLIGRIWPEQEEVKTTIYND